MTQRLSDAIVAQHRHVTNLVDRIEARRAPRPFVERSANALLAHLLVEEELLSEVFEQVRSFHLHVEEHVTVRFALERLRLPAPPLLLRARVTALRELLVHHIEPEERVLLPAVELLLGRRRSLSLARAVSRRFEQLLEAPVSNETP